MVRVAACARCTEVVGGLTPAGAAPPLLLCMFALARLACTRLSTIRRLFCGTCLRLGPCLVGHASAALRGSGVRGAPTADGCACMRAMHASSMRGHRIEWGQGRSCHVGRFPTNGASVNTSPAHHTTHGAVACQPLHSFTTAARQRVHSSRRRQRLPAHTRTSLLRLTESQTLLRCCLPAYLLLQLLPLLPLRAPPGLSCLCCTCLCRTSLTTPLCHAALLSSTSLCRGTPQPKCHHHQAFFTRKSGSSVTGSTLLVFHHAPSRPS